MKLQLICPVCQSEFFRWSTTIRNGQQTICCSTKCRGELSKESLKGSNNPNYKHGKYSNPQYCSCGNRKDFRAKICWDCRCTSKEILEKLPLVLSESSSFSEASNKLNIPRATLTRFVKLNGYSVDHMMAGKGRPRSDSQIFCKKKTRDCTTKKYFKLKVKQVCIECGIGLIWNDKELTLQMDHIDGDPLNDELNNLRWLCPNCHTQTSTYCGRNMAQKVVI